MKRTVLLSAILAITLLTTASLVMAQPLVPSVPPFINLQGRATDNVGNPVSNGAHTFTFRIFNVPAAGAALWTEGPLGITTAGGLFTHQLGSSTPLPIGGFIGGFFQDENQLWLEIEVDGNIISPRTQLISNPYTQVANMVETEPQNGIGIVTVRIPTPLTDCHISTYGGGGLQKSQLGNCAWGEFMLMDFTPETTATLTANPGGGGELRLTDGGGLPTIDLHGGLSGDASAILPTDAVNSVEILDEPGIAQGRNLGGTSIISSAAMVDLATVTITIPAAGYIFVEGRGLAEISGTTSANGIAAQIDETAGGALDFARFSLFGMNPPPSAGFVDGELAAQQTYFKAAGTYTFRLEGISFYPPAGSRTVYFPVVTATYYPTAYGGVTTVASKPSEFGNAVAKTVKMEMPNGLESTEMVYQTDLGELGLKARESERAKQMAEMEARIKALEAQANTDRLPERGMVGPRKER